MEAQPLPRWLAHRPSHLDSTLCQLFPSSLATLGTGLCTWGNSTRPSKATKGAVAGPRQELAPKSRRACALAPSTRLARPRPVSRPGRAAPPPVQTTHCLNAHASNAPHYFPLCPGPAESSALTPPRFPSRGRAPHSRGFEPKKACAERISPSGYLEPKWLRYRAKPI